MDNGRLRAASVREGPPAAAVALGMPDLGLDDFGPGFEPPNIAPADNSRDRPPTPSTSSALLMPCDTFHSLAPNTWASRIPARWAQALWNGRAATLLPVLPSNPTYEPRRIPAQS